MHRTIAFGSLLGGSTQSTSLTGLALEAPNSDRMDALLVERADSLMGCTEGSPKETELAALADAIEA